MIIDTEKGICITCNNAKHCDMERLLIRHRRNIKLFGENYKHTHPYEWESDAIDEPDVKKKGEVEWCPLFEHKGDTEDDNKYNN